MVVDEYSYKTKQYGAICTILLHGIIFLFLLMQIHTPIPPYPEGGGGTGDGIELNLGSAETGSGTNPLEFMASSEVVSSPAVAEPQKDDGKLLTQDVEDVPPIKEQNVEVKKTVKKDVKPVVAVTTNKTVKKETEKKPVVNEQALYRSGKNTSADGSSNVAGDQGNPNGSLAAKAFGGKGGSGGSGGGSGGGQGTGIGIGTGPGISYDLEGRNPVGALPKPEYRQQVEGIVVVDIIVDKEGNVTQAIAGVKGSTTLEYSLLVDAKRAALKAKFDRKTDAPAFQKGKITYRFRLQ